MSDNETRELSPSEAPAVVPEVMPPPGRPKPLTPNSRVVDLINQGYSTLEIAKICGVSKDAIHRAVWRARKKGLVPKRLRRSDTGVGHIPGADVYELLAGADRQTRLKAGRLVLECVDSIIPEMKRLLFNAKPEDAVRVKMAEVWARIIFPAVKRSEHTGAGGAPLSILFKGIDRGPQTVK